MPSRREFLGAMTWPIAASVVPGCAVPRLAPETSARLDEMARRDGSPEELARDEDFWGPVQAAFTVDRTLINLNNGGVSPSPAVVQDSVKRYLDFSNQAPSHNMWRILEPRKETVRAQIAGLFGCDAEEIAIVRNASEGLQICQFGFDLEPGDEVLTTNQDYPRMITTWKQRERREGIVLRQVSVPTPCEDPADFVRAIERGITDRTRLILICHMINLTGQIVPVRDVCRMAKRRGIPVIVDGAHAFAHFPFQQSDLECDYYAASLHKWLFAPHGTGMLYVRRDKIDSIWPLMASSAEHVDDIRKFEEIGTHPLANILGIGDAVTFHDRLGSERKAARLRYLRDYWAKRLTQSSRVRLHTSLQPHASCGIATVEIEGVSTRQLHGHLLRDHRIITTGIVHAEFNGLRISPSVYTTRPELDRFCEAMEAVIRDGLPG